jgi:hypothetical protein
MRLWANRRNRQQSGSNGWLTELQIAHDASDEPSSQQARRNDQSPSAVQTGGIANAECRASVAGGCMADTKTLIEQAYSAFNKRDIDGALALMAEDVSWPKASEGGRVVGKEEIRAYWTRQWGRVRFPCRTAGNHRGGWKQGPRHGTPTRQEPSRRCSIGQRSSPHIHREQRSYRNYVPQG